MTIENDVIRIFPKSTSVESLGFDLYRIAIHSPIIEVSVVVKAEPHHHICDEAYILLRDCLLKEMNEKGGVYAKA